MNAKKSIELLNKGVADELQAVHQYMYWHFHLDDQGFAPLAAMFKHIAIQEMGHVERFAERILFLKGDVEIDKQLDNIQRFGPNYLALQSFSKAPAVE